MSLETSHTGRGSTFQITHLDSNQVFERHDVYFNSSSSNNSLPPSPVDPDLVAFHRDFPDSKETPLTELPELAQDLGVGHVFVKDESLRFGLPSFKILGASWGVFRAVCEQTGLSPSVSLERAGRHAREADIKLVTCTDGNWGRAVSRMAKYLGIQATVFVPQSMDESTQEKLRCEGATVHVVRGTYDQSIAAALRESESSGAMLVMDTSWKGFERISQWVVDGYATMHQEVDRQLHEACGRIPTLCIASVGVGSWAQSVVAHYTANDAATKVITVESEAAPCLMESLYEGKIIPVETGSTIMDGMNCGTISTIAWPILREGVHASVVVNDSESHECVRYLNDHGINAGPCGAAPLAALKKLLARNAIQRDPQAVIVLFSTEGNRTYTVPS